MGGVGCSRVELTADCLVHFSVGRILQTSPSLSDKTAIRAGAGDNGECEGLKFSRKSGRLYLCS